MNHVKTFSMPYRQTGATLAISLILLAIATLVGVAAMQGTTLQEKMAGNLRDSSLAFQAADSALLAGENDGLRNFYRNWVGEFLQDRNLDGVVDGGPPGVTCPPLPPEYYGGAANPCNVPVYPIAASPAGGTYVFPLNVQNPVSAANRAGAWVLDEDANGFPIGTRLDPNANNTVYWWYERNGAWWTGLPTNQGRPLPNNTLGIFGNPAARQPRYLIEYVDYPAADPLNRDDALTRVRAADGLVQQNKKEFRRERHFYRVTAWGQGGTDQTIVMLQSNFYWIFFLPNI